MEKKYETTTSHKDTKCRAHSSKLTWSQQRVPLP